MSNEKLSCLVLVTDLYGKAGTPEALQQFADLETVDQVRVIPAEMNEQDWDQVVQAILDHDKCLTL